MFIKIGDRLKKLIFQRFFSCEVREDIYAKKTQRLSNLFAELSVNLSALCVESKKSFCFELSDKIGRLVNLFAGNVGFVTRDELSRVEFNFKTAHMFV